MRSLTIRHQLMIGVALAALLIVTRGQHFPTLNQALPSASWAVFFIAGVYLRSLWAPLGLFVLASLVDFAAINWQGVSDYCVSPAYIALIPAYGALWGAGRWYARRCSFNTAALFSLIVAAFAGTAVCEFISSASFYFYSGRFPAVTWSEFAARELTFFPAMLRSTLFWIGGAALVHASLLTLHAGDRPKPI